jgi:hypothetical protein
LRGVAIGHDRLQAGAVGGRNFDGDPVAHPTKMGCPKREPSVSVKPLGAAGGGLFAWLRLLAARLAGSMMAAATAALAGLLVHAIGSQAF